MKFVNAMGKIMNDEYNYSTTENGALGYATTNKPLLDLNFSVASMRNMDESAIADRFMNAFYENRMLAMKWLFFARDVRGGLGERRFFRVVLERLAITNTEIVKAVISLIPEYGRFDDMWCLLDNDELADVVGEFVYNQLCKDWRNMKNNKPISLLAKWMPSINASSVKTKKYAKKFCKMFNTSEATYRKTLSALRKYLNVVEVKMSAKDWSDINYEAVPSKANLLYNDAFLRNDSERRRMYLSQLTNGEVKINADTLYPHDIVHKYNYSYRANETLEALWKSLPDTVKGCSNTIVVADGSGSMTWNGYTNSSVTPLDVANGLAIYFAEHSTGEFKDKYITFSMRPQLVDFSECTSLCEKLKVAQRHCECANTNIEAVFDLILKTAIQNNMRQEDMPHNILIISDMEFDECARTNADYRTQPNGRLFDIIGQRYHQAGYKMPRLVFWNVASRTETIPIIENELGVALVSGFSTNIAKMVMSNKLDAYECLLEAINARRYDAVEEAVQRAL